MTLVIYAGRHGTTERYARWIAEKTGADLYPVQQVTSKTLLRYDAIVYGGAVYGGTIEGIAFLKKHLDDLKEHPFFLFTVGLTMPGDDAAFSAMLERNLTAEQLKGIRLYHFLGAIRFKALAPGERLMMWMLKKTISKKPVRSPIEQDIVDYYNGELDYSNETYIADLAADILRESPA